MSDELEPIQRDTLRASDLDRNRVVTMLSEALGHGQLTFPEYEERSRSAVEARTFADLDRLVIDLPAVSVQPAAPAVPGYQAPAIPPEGLPRLGDHKVAVMSGTNVRGPIAVGAEHSATAFWGGVRLDLREATFLTRDVTINAYALMGGVEIIVPRGTIVQVDGLAIMGSFENNVRHVGAGTGPRIRVTGFAFWGGVEVKTK